MADLSFGPFSVDVAATRVVRHGIDLRLRPRAFHALKVLALNSGKLVSYEQMIAQAWDGVSVSRHTVDVTVGEVRKTLREYGCWISHRRKVGYCLEVPGSEQLIKKGWHYRAQATREGYERALTCFEQAAREDDHNFDAFHGAAHCCLALAVHGMRPPREMYTRFLAAHERAESLGGPTPELRINRAHGLHMCERRLVEAEVELLATLREQPTLAWAYVPTTMLYASWGRLDEALDVLDRAHKVDPLLPHLPALETFVRVCRRETDTAMGCGRRAVELHPHLQVGRIFYALALEEAGHLDESLEQIRIARALSPDLPWLCVIEGICLVKHGQKHAAHARLDEIEETRASEYVDAYFMAALREALGDRHAAFAELERAIDENSAALFALDVDPKMDPFRSDRRFSRLRNKVFEAALAH